MFRLPRKDFNKLLKINIHNNNPLVTLYSKDLKLNNQLEFVDYRNSIHKIIKVYQEFEKKPYQFYIKKNGRSLVLIKDNCLENKPYSVEIDLDEFILRSNENFYQRVSYSLIALFIGGFGLLCCT